MGKKNIIIMVVVAVVFAAGGFFGGIKYGQSAGELKKLTPAQMQAAFAGSRGTGAAGAAAFAGGARRGGGAGAAAGGGFVSGQILSQNANSMTIQLPGSAGSKIVFLSASSQILKSTTGAVSDLTTGENVTVTGTTGSDGSITAQTIQIRPTTPPATSTQTQ